MSLLFKCKDNCVAYNVSPFCLAEVGSDYHSMFNEHRNPTNNYRWFLSLLLVPHILNLYRQVGQLVAGVLRNAGN